jgi:hypothetical protein
MEARTSISMRSEFAVASFVIDPDGNNIEAVWYDDAMEKG